MLASKVEIGSVSKLWGAFAGARVSPPKTEMVYFDCLLKYHSRNSFDSKCYY